MPWPGDIVHVWEPKGLSINSYGEVAINETMTTSSGRVDPSDEIEILDGAPSRNDHFKARRISDRLEFVIHPNHYDPGTAHNLHSSKKTPTKALEAAYLAQRTQDRSLKP
jgi:hypothetical protein